MRRDENKKVCFISTVPITLSTFVLPFAEYLHRHTNWKIYFICAPDDNFKNSLPKYIRYLPVEMKRGISVGGIAAVIKMIRIFRHERFDLIQYSTPNAAFYASIAGYLARIKNRLYCQWGMAFVGFSGWKRLLFKAIEKTVCVLSTKIEPDSHGNLEFAVGEKLYKRSKGEVIWNGSACGVDFAKFDVSRKGEFRRENRERYKIGDDTFVFGFVGRITRDKGVNELFAAFKNILISQKAVLLMVGPNEVGESVDAELYHWTKESDCVIYTGYTNAVEAYLAMMDCYVLPSYREGFGLGVVEAGAMKVPVIVTDIPGPKDSVTDGENGTVIPARDKKALYRAMSKMMREDIDRDKMGEMGFVYAKKKYDRNRLFEMMLEDRRRIIAG